MLTKKDIVAILYEAWEILDTAYSDVAEVSCSPSVMGRINVAMAATVEAINMLEINNE